MTQGLENVTMALAVLEVVSGFNRSLNCTMSIRL
jgi:hypothetical protein